MVIFHSCASLPEGSQWINQSPSRTVVEYPLRLMAQIYGLQIPWTHQLSHENVLVDWSVLGECLLDYDSAA